ncbi:hypothetical protein SAMN04488523_108139 [Sulfitobacter brevis]|uniref:Uncharacterized protein n=1 Tax=Sulfitobacter brevis TaxID=74348 RepID=A0A1I2BNJ6_9RHOB|nr:hypothetical protein SAMN04488523_108139 [Sulfitobacter brevis]
MRCGNNSVASKAENDRVKDTKASYFIGQSGRFAPMQKAQITHAFLAIVPDFISAYLPSTPPRKSA